MASEGRRHERIAYYINELAKIVPGCETSKGGVVQGAAQYIMQLRDNEAQTIEQWVLERTTLEQTITELSGSWEKLQAECKLEWLECEKWRQAAQKASGSVDSDSRIKDTMPTPGLIKPNMDLNSEPERKPKEWRTMTNDHGSKLKIQTPEQYTFEELKWIKQHHSTTDPSQPLKIIRGETEVPKDPRTRVMDTFHYWCWQNTQAVQGYKPPEWFERDYNLRKTAVDREEAKWQPKRPEAKKRER
jgi:hypothetical protein